jgi:hypothetical protein
MLEQELERVMGIEPTLVAWDAPTRCQADDLTPLAAASFPSRHLSGLQTGQRSMLAPMEVSDGQGRFE